MRTEIRLLQISNYIYPNIGGIEQGARDIIDTVAGWSSAHITQKLICFNTDAYDGHTVTHHDETVHDTVDGVEVIRCSTTSRKVASQSISFSFGIQLRKVMDDFDPDIVIFHYPNPLEAHYLLNYRYKKFKLILYWHLDIVKQKLLGSLFMNQNEKLLEWADRVVATSPDYAAGSRWLSQVPEKCVVIPNCINESRLKLKYDDIIRSEHIRQEVGRDKIICFAVGRHIEYKGLKYLVEASKLLDDRFVIRIAGEGPLTEELKAEAAGDDKIEFLGRIDDAELRANMHACDIYCFPSITKNEAFGIALAEAMYYAKPSVTFNIPGSGVNYVSIDAETGLEAENSNAEDYALKLTRLADYKELRDALGANARKRVLKLFTQHKFEENIRQLLTDVIGRL